MKRSRSWSERGPRCGKVQVVAFVLDPSLPADTQQVAESRGGEEGNPSPLALDHRVGRQRGAVYRSLDLRSGHAALGQVGCRSCNLLRRDGHLVHVADQVDEIVMMLAHVAAHQYLLSDPPHTVQRGASAPCDRRSG